MLQLNLNRIGIIGAGWIAEKMAQAVAPLKDIKINTISSRSIEKAKLFAAKVIECKCCIEKGLIESPMMPHEETISIMKQDDI